MVQKSTTHETVVEHKQVTSGSDRAFGLVFAVVFLVIGAFPLIDGRAPLTLVLIVAAIFLAVAIVRPKLLAPLNRIWFRFGLLLHKIVSPIVMGILFFVVLMPIGLIMRVSGKDILGLRRDASAVTYWVARTPPGPEPDTMKNQF